jgi:hypothetical protein
MVDPYKVVNFFVPDLTSFEVRETLASSPSPFKNYDNS